MIKRTPYFGNPVYLKTNNKQLVFKSIDKGKTILVTIEDIGVVIKQHQQIIITQTSP